MIARNRPGSQHAERQQTPRPCRHRDQSAQAASSALLAAPSPETFSTVCNALADVADAGDEVDRVRFLDAVDRAQNLATACGLLRTIGQDAVQAIMAQSFRRCRVHPRPSAEPTPKHREAAKVTVDALIFSLRERGAAALSERTFLNRLSDLSSDQIHDVIRRLIALRSRYPNITDELLFKLGDQL